MTDLNANIATILNDLAAAFGGHSQVPAEVVGQALHGQWANNPGMRASTVDEAIDAAARLIAERWEGADLAATRVKVKRGFTVHAFNVTMATE